MTVGISATHSASVLNVLRGTSYTGVTPYLKLHIGDPGSAGTANASSETSRKQLTFAAPSGGSAVASAVSWTSWSATSGESLSYFSIWDASTAGTFLMSGQFTTPKTVTTGDTFNATITATQGTLAA